MVREPECVLSPRADPRGQPRHFWHAVVPKWALDQDKASGRAAHTAALRKQGDLHRHSEGGRIKDTDNIGCDPITDEETESQKNQLTYLRSNE